MIGCAFVPAGTCGEGSRRNVAEPFSLRPISASAVPKAIKKAEHYRLLNDAEQAESICLDILAVDPGDEQALVVLILAITDQFGRSGGPSVNVALAEYLKRARRPVPAQLLRGPGRRAQARGPRSASQSGSSFAYDGFADRDGVLREGERHPPADDDEAILRWNACVRTIERAHLEPRPAEDRAPLE